jgi:hypothetical protein
MGHSRRSYRGHAEVVTLDRVKERTCDADFVELLRMLALTGYATGGVG